MMERQPGRGHRAQGRVGPREAEVAARWAAGAWLGWSLRAEDGATYTLLFQGRPGGPAGPDFRDAALVDGTGRRVTGDIEIHLSPAGWWAHGHADDPRYNEVALHVTLWPPGERTAASTPLANGRVAPIVALAAQRAPEPSTVRRPVWPCASTCRAEGIRALEAAGWERFEERAARYADDMQQEGATPEAQKVTAGDEAPESSAHTGSWSHADRALFVGLAEALGYGRDRESMRAAGTLLAHELSADATEKAVASLGALERRRLVGLLALRERWGETGPHVTLAEALARGAERAGPRGAWNALIEALRVRSDGAVSPGRARILAVNVALPTLAARPVSPGINVQQLARETMAVASGLPSNQITRAMARQLRMDRLPPGALAQQGMQQVWTRHCREKRCEGCPCATLEKAQEQPTSQEPPAPPIAELSATPGAAGGSGRGRASARGSHRRPNR